MVQENDVDAGVARTLLELIAALPVGSEAIITMVYGRPAHGLIALRMNIEAALADVFRSKATDHATRVASSELVPYDPGRELLDGESSFRATSQIPQAQPLLELLAHPMDLGLFRPEAMNEGPPRFYVVSVRDRGDETRYHLLRKLTAGYRLNRSKLTAVIWRNGVYDELREEPVLLSDDFDAVMTDEITVVTNQRNLDAMLGLVDESVAIARSRLAEVTTDLRFANYAEFEDAVVRDLNMLAKLRSIVELRKDAKYRDAMTMDRMVAFARDIPDVGIDIQGPEGQEMFVFHSDPQRRWKLLRLLDDQFVRSLITDVEYEANSKSRLRP